MKPRAGVIEVGKLTSEFIDEIITESVNLSYLDFLDNLKKEGKSDEEIEEESEYYESQDDTYLAGDWKEVKGKYVVDKKGKEGFAGTYNGGTLVVEWSKHTKKCGPTSPCFVMSDGSGPCGDLDSEGDLVAYTLPSDCFIQEEPSNSVKFFTEKED